MTIVCDYAAKLQEVQAYIVASFAAQGETLASLPWSYAIAQYPFDSDNCPMLIGELGKLTSTPDFETVGVTTFTVALTLHHIRSRSGVDDNEEELCVDRLRRLAAAICTDYRLGGSVQSATPEVLLIGDATDLGKQWNLSFQNSGLAIASLVLRICWNESLYS